MLWFILCILCASWIHMSDVCFNSRSIRLCLRGVCVLSVLESFCLECSFVGAETFTEGILSL